MVRLQSGKPSNVFLQFYNITYQKMSFYLLIKGGVFYRRASDYRNMIFVPIIYSDLYSSQIKIFTGKFS